MNEDEKKCIRCGYKWVALIKEPKVCPSCKSYSWNKERVRK